MERAFFSLRPDHLTRLAMRGKLLILPTEFPAEAAMPTLCQNPRGEGMLLVSSHGRCGVFP
jgi:hypothetical protein